MNVSLAELLQIIGDKEVTILTLRSEILELNKKLAEKVDPPKEDS